MVAYLRKYKYRKFQRKRKAVDRAEEPTVGIKGRRKSGKSEHVSIAQY